MPSIPQRRFVLRTVGALALAAALPARAQTARVSGEVTKVDAAGGRITIKHDGIKNLDMPPMSMAFRAADTKLLNGIAVGDKVQFTAERINGQYTVTSLSKAP
jgi:Cu(I)/Ag(I) efflux system periplasmic protein CusF